MKCSFRWHAIHVVCFKHVAYRRFHKYPTFHWSSKLWNFFPGELLASKQNPLAFCVVIPRSTSEKNFMRFGDMVATTFVHIGVDCPFFLLSADSRAPTTSSSRILKLAKRTAIYFFRIVKPPRKVFGQQERGGTASDGQKSATLPIFLFLVRW